MGLASTDIYTDLSYDYWEKDRSTGTVVMEYTPNLNGVCATYGVLERIFSFRLGFEGVTKRRALSMEL